MLNCKKLMPPLYELRIRTWRPYWFGCHKIWSDMSSRSIADLQLRRCKKINQGLPCCQIEENPIGYYLHLLMWFCSQSWVFQTLRGTSFAQEAMAGNTNELAASYSTNWWVHFQIIATCFSVMEEHIIPPTVERCQNYPRLDNLFLFKLAQMQEAPWRLFCMLLR